jgi:hypothetical protein
MCLIVDTNLAADFFCGTNAALAPLRKAVMEDASCCLCYGGSKLRREYLRSPKIMKIIVALDQAGRAKSVRDSLVDKRMDLVSGQCSSDDPHIIALAVESGARLLCSHDIELHRDFTNPVLINNPKGQVYQNSTHGHLIRKHAKHC